jgi:hypothetical protein
MQTDESQYVHQPVYGLPASLISLDEKVLPVIALMQREAGLNRERRREIQSDARFYGEPDARLRRAVSKTDWSVLTYYLSAGERFGSFWCVVKRLLEPQRRQGAKAFAFAVDVQLLKAYEPGWLTLPFDESTLTAECEEWPRIRSRFERRSGFDQGSTPLGMFMLWPRLIVDLKCWEDLNAGRRLQVGHAIFALSSIGWTDWFVAKAVAFCPEIQPELGALLKASVQATAADERGQTAEELHMGEAEQVASTDARAGSAAQCNLERSIWKHQLFGKRHSRQQVWRRNLRSWMRRLDPIRRLVSQRWLPGFKEMPHRTTDFACVIAVRVCATHPYLVRGLIRRKSSNAFKYIFHQGLLLEKSCHLGCRLDRASKTLVPFRKLFLRQVRSIRLNGHQQPFGLGRSLDRRQGRRRSSRCNDDRNIVTDYDHSLVVV